MSRPFNRVTHAEILISRRRGRIAEKRLAAVQDLVDRGAKNGWLTADDIADSLGRFDWSAEQIDSIYNLFATMRIDILEEERTTSIGAYSASGVESHPDQPPPKLGEKALLLLLPRRSGQALVGDLREEWTSFVLPQYGLRFARRWFWVQAIRSLASLFMRGAGKLLSLQWLVTHARRWYGGS